MRREIERDLSSDLQRRVGEVLQRQIKIAQHVLEPAELAIVLAQLAVSVNLTAAATVASGAPDAIAAARSFDFMIASIARFTAGDRERSLAAVAERREAGAAA